MGRVLGLAIALAGAAAGVGDERQGPAPTIQGKWEVTAARFNGAECPAPKGCTLAAGEQEVMIYDEGVQVRTLSYALDPKVNPPRIDLVRDGTGAKALGI